MKRNFSLARLAPLVAFALAATLGVQPASAQLVHRNPRINNGEIRIDPLLCQTDYEVRKTIAAAGFTHIFLNAPINDRIRIRASRGSTVYLIDYRRCLRTGILGVQPLRSAK